MRRSAALAALLAGGISHPTPAQPLAERIDSYLRGRPGPAFSGTLVVARGDSVLFRRAYGFADADLSIPNTPELHFNIGSVTKPITAVAVLRLVQRGQVRLDEAICPHLATCPESWRAVTVGHLVAHTSGIPDLFRELPAAPADSLRSVTDAAIGRHGNGPLRAAPGERYAYSNFNYILLGYLLETVGGEGWEEVLRREVFEPAGMTATEYDDVWRIMPRRVRGYELAEGRLRHVRYHDHAAYTAGGLLSTADDLLRFDRALSGGRLLEDALFRLMVTPGPGDYGLGWQVIRAFGLSLRNHTGGVTGFASHLAHYQDGTVIVLLSNVEDELAKATACDVAALVFGRVPAARSPGAIACPTD